MLTFTSTSDPYPVTTPPLPTRPFSVAMLSIFQFSKAVFLVMVAVLAWLGLANTLSAIPRLHDLIFLAAHGKDPHGILLFVLGLYGAFVGQGLWNLKRWARNSLFYNALFMLVFWFIHQDFGTRLFLMPGAENVEHETIYLLLLIDSAIFLFLKFHSDAADSFPKKRKRRRPTPQPAYLADSFSNSTR
jgi:hypothetical protein